MSTHGNPNLGCGMGSALIYGVLFGLLSIRVLYANYRGTHKGTTILRTTDIGLRVLGFVLVEATRRKKTSAGQQPSASQAV